VENSCKKHGQREICGWIFTLSPDSGRGRAANPASLSLGRLAELRRAPDAGGWESCFEVGGLGRAASPRPPSWANKVGYLTLVYVLFCLEKN